MRVPSHGALAGVATLVLIATSGCVGSEKPYRPYKGEARPTVTPGPDPVEAEVNLEHDLPHDLVEHTTYIDQTRKASREVLRTVHLNDNGSPRNAWIAYEDDVDSVLGKDVLKHHFPKPKAKPDHPEPKKEGGDEGDASGGGGGDKPAADKPADAGDKPADKPADSGDKPADAGGGN